MTTKRIFFLLIMLLLVTSTFIYPCKNGQAEISLEGKIKSSGGNWVIQANDQDYIIKFDQEALNNTELKLVAGDKIRIHGTLADNEITPCEIYYQGKYYTFSSDHSESGCFGGHDRRGRRR